ncbi:MAG TPA: serine/threonine-protein kinase, partial [Minicystis sp.]|nr:serine/threonine-protein kinase [Minicystis sp.]
MAFKAPLPGSILLGKYRVERVLGEGGMGVVVEATHLELDQSVAIKLLGRHEGREEEMLARFRNEAQIAARLPAEHIVHAIDAGRTEDGDAYLVMELLPGRDLDQELDARGRLPIKEAVDYVLQACEGVAEAHAVGLVHRDLKPANLFLTRSRRGAPIVKVLDFGIATCLPGARLPSITSEGELFGTPVYMAPEQFDSGGEVDARCDQRALATVLFELCAGTPPFFDEHPGRLARQVATEAPPRLSSQLPSLPRALDAAVAKAMALRPAERFADLAAFARAIAPFGSQPEAREAADRIAFVLGTGPASAKRRRPRRLGRALAATVAVGL